jgi:hypothetical protein
VCKKCFEVDHVEGQCSLLLNSTGQ